MTEFWFGVILFASFWYQRCIRKLLSNRDRIKPQSFTILSSPISTSLFSLLLFKSSHLKIAKYLWICNMRLMWQHVYWLAINMNMIQFYVALFDCARDVSIIAFTSSKANSVVFVFVLIMIEVDIKMVGSEFENSSFFCFNRRCVGKAKCHVK